MKKIKVVLALSVVFIMLMIAYPKKSDEYLKPTLDACSADSCIGFKVENCSEKYSDQLGDFDKCTFQCFGVLLKTNNDCSQSINLIGN